MTYTQKQASDPDYSVWVNASAGTGKTKVLTDRVLRLLLEGTPPGKILCLTFTNAAASEMSNRIYRELEKWILLDDHALTQRIEALHKKPSDDLKVLARRLFALVLDAPDGIKIQTIHAFCQTLMKRFPLEANIPPHFQVIDEQTSSELFKDAWLTLLSAKDKQDQAVQDAIWQLAARVHDGNLTAVMRELMSQRGRLYYLSRKYTKEEFVDALYQQLGVSRQNNEQAVRLQACCDDSFDIAGLRRVCDILLASKSKTTIKRGKNIANWLGAEPKDRVEGLDMYMAQYLKKDGEPLAKLATKDVMECNEVLQEEQQRLERVSDHIKSLHVARHTTWLFVLSQAFLTMYDELKSRRAFLDYSDLITISNRLLSHPEAATWVLFKLDGGIDHLLVDEAQDTSPEQWQVIRALSEEFFSEQGGGHKQRTIFVVGDEKQSIFRFQGADPEEFKRMHQFFGSRVTRANQNWRSLSLDLSFRSSSPVLKLVDSVFSLPEVTKHFAPASGVIKHQTYKAEHYGKVELWPLVEGEKEEPLQPWQLPDRYQLQQSSRSVLVNQLVDTITDWLNDKRFLPSKGRAVKPGDIMVLVRRRTDLVPMLVSRLKKHNIPVAGIDRMKLTDNLAVEDLMALGNFLLLPQDDLTLAVVLKGPFIGVSEDDLFELCYDRQDQSLWQVLTAKHADKPIFTLAYDFLKELLSKTGFITPFELYSFILDVKDGRKQLIRRLGYEINDPVDEFLTLTLSYEKSHVPSLQGFLHWLESSNMTIKRDLDQGQNEVRIMTVHGSKGLQAPIVILPDTTQVTQKSDAVLWDELNDFMMLWYGKAENQNKRCKEIKKRHADKEYSEYLRLLYVALTRAEDELYILGEGKTKSHSRQSWYDLVETAMQQCAGERDGVLCFESEQIQECDVDDTPDDDDINKYPLPDFVWQVPKSDSPMPADITPSMGPADEDNLVVSASLKHAAWRGRLIHKLLEYLPDIQMNKWHDFAQSYIAKYGYDMSTQESSVLVADVLRLLEDSAFKVIFNSPSRAEVPIVGTIGAHRVSGQIDRLVVLDDEVLIVDYKTARQPPANAEEVPKKYLQQMNMYRLIVEKIYTSHRIRCLLLWTEVPCLMDVTPQLAVYESSDHKVLDLAQ